MGTFLLHLLFLILYFGLILALVPVIFKVFSKVPDEWVRKFQHIGYASSIFIYVYLFESWQYALLAIGIFMATMFFVLWSFELTPYYKTSFVDRGKSGGELKYSLLLAQGMFALLIILFMWLLPNSDETIVVIAVMSWGVGDALAALVGKRFGKSKIRAYGADHNKTIVGSHAMSYSVFLLIFLLLFFFADVVWWVSLIIAAIVSPIATLIEAYARKGTDTILLPLGTAFALYGLLMFFTSIGVI